jgi:S-adenosylmethionine-diacylglycerol 3-amino-3-carboxypropyl transferase
MPTAAPLSPPPVRSRAGSLARAAHDAVFRRVHGSNLIYNAAWEDPRLDRQLMGLDGESEVVMITSAGCNALDYLLDGPRQVHAIDVNPRQNALLELKRALIRRGDFEDLFAMFGGGSHPRYQALYAELRSELPAYAQRFWDRRIAFFDPRSVKGSFYFHGTSGVAAWVMGKALFQARPTLKKIALCLLEAASLEEQRQAYTQLEPEIWGRLANWLVRQPALMALLGVPRPQIRLIQASYPGGLTSYVKDKLRHVLTELPTAENYFWRVYLTGFYSPSCCPNYLRAEHQAQLREMEPRLTAHTCTVSDFLRKHPGHYSHYVLLDHQDWLAWHDPAALLEEWDLILANSRPGTKILMRSAGLDLSFVPEPIRQRVTFHPELTAPLHQLDRVGTYGSFHFGIVKDS